MTSPAGEDPTDAVADGDGGVVVGPDDGAVDDALGLVLDVAQPAGISSPRSTRDRTFVRWLGGFTLAMLAGIP